LRMPEMFSNRVEPVLVPGKSVRARRS